jgi:hypothetical protein
MTCPNQPGTTSEMGAEARTDPATRGRPRRRGVGNGLRKSVAKPTSDSPSRGDETSRAKAPGDGTGDPIPKGGRMQTRDR